MNKDNIGLGDLFSKIPKEPFQMNDATLVNANKLAEMLSVSVRHIWRMKASGKLPKPVWVGGCVRWRMDDINLFIELGCPSQREFEIRKKA